MLHWVDANASMLITFRTKQLERGALREHGPGCAAGYEIARGARAEGKKKMRCVSRVA